MSKNVPSIVAIFFSSHFSFSSFEDVFNPAIKNVALPQSSKTPQTKKDINKVKIITKSTRCTSTFLQTKS